MGSKQLGFEAMFWKEHSTKNNSDLGEEIKKKKKREETLDGVNENCLQKIVGNKKN